MNKKKIFLPIATGLFVAVTLFNVNLLKSNNPGDVSLDAIAIMAQAQSETGGGGGLANLCCPIWNVTVEIYWYGTNMTCSTGGNYKCNNCSCSS